MKLAIWMRIFQILLELIKIMEINKQKKKKANDLNMKSVDLILHSKITLLVSFSNIHYSVHLSLMNQICREVQEV